MSREYNEYLQEHKTNVANAFYWIQTYLPELLYNYPDMERQITSAHDQSKSDKDEYDAYDTYFYGNDQSYSVKENFNYAWLSHIHKNQHHWQHWVLNNDDPTEGEVIMDIPYNYIIEMICDWWSFAFKQNNLYSIFDWYNQHKDYMKLSNNTRRQVEDILKTINIKIAELNGDDLNDR